MQVDDGLSYDEANRLLQGLGSEDNLATRIAIEREARGWSQSELARQMAAAGFPINQTAISKIERPQRGGRRAISVDEAVAFSTVFDVPLVELLLPREALRNLAITRDIAAGPDALIARDEASRRYEEIASNLAALYRQDAGWRQSLQDELRRVTTACVEQGDPPALVARMLFLHDVAIQRQKKGTKR